MYQIIYVDGSERSEKYSDLHLAQQRWDSLAERGFHMISRRP